MRTRTQHISHIRLATLLLVVAVLICASLLGGSASVVAAPTAATLTSTACSGSGPVSCDLWAKTGSITLPGPSGPVSVPIWGYATTSGGAAILPGPLLIINQGTAVNITLHNVNLPSATSLAVSQQNMLPDTAGVTAGNSKIYSFPASGPTALQPGTYLYEAGVTADGPRQEAMGLFGALIVRPTGCASCAYPVTTTNDSTYADEALLVLSEIDPAFNAAPATFDMGAYAPKYWLINGKVYPNTDPIATTAGNQLLLRYINAGLKHHSMSLLGLRQTIVATDGKPATYTPYQVAAQTIPTGSSLDTIVTVPTSAPTGAKYPLYDAAMHVDNSGARTGTGSGTITFGGMLAFVTLVGTAPPPGPVTNNVALSNNPNNGTVPVTLSVRIGVAGDPAIDQAEYFVDIVGTAGSGCPITTGLGAAPASVSRVIPTTGGVAPCTDLATLTSANHTFYVHGHNANGWGGFGSAVLKLDKLGPATNTLALTPNPTNGTVSVALDATGNDMAAGNSNVDRAEYGIDTCPTGGSGTAMTINTPPAPATIVHFVATIAQPTVNGLSQGAHTIYVHSHDAVGATSGNWGPCAAITLNVDKSAPNTTGVIANPNPTNGTIGLLIGDFIQQKVSATVTDPVAGGISSNIQAVEGFIDTVSANGSGIVFLANDGAFNSPSEGVYAAIPLFAIQALTEGPHTIYVHGQDAAGNWGATATTILIVDKTGPNVTSASAAPNPTNGATSATLSASATDPIVTGTSSRSNIIAAEWFDGADPGAGSGNAMTGTFGSTTVSNLSATISTAGMSFGTHNIGVRAKDVAGNWGPVTVVLLNVTPSDSIFADGFESGNFSAWSTTGGTVSQISVTGTGAMVGTKAMQAVISGGASGFVQNNSPSTSDAAYRARFYFNPNSTTTATGQQHDIFVALNSSNQTVFRIQYRRSSSSGNAAQVRAVVTRSGGTTTGAWFTINTNAANVIEVSWLAGSSTTFTLYTNGTAHTLTGLNTSSSSLRIDTIRMGPQVGPAPVGSSTPSGTSLSGASGTEYFDAFVSRRNDTLIGP